MKGISDVCDLMDQHRPGHHDHNKVVAFITLLWVLVIVTLMVVLKIAPNGWHCGILVALLAAGFGPRVFLKYLAMRNGTGEKVPSP